MERVHARNKGGVCVIDDCDLPRKSRQMCSAHYQRWLRGARQDGSLKRYTARLRCEIEGCDSLHAARGMCISHYGQWRKTGTVRPIRVPTGRTVTGGGYIRIKDVGHPNADSRGWVLEHIKAVSEVIGRPLLPEETVHHKNGDKHDNQPENLELWSSRHPKGQRVEDLVAFAKEILALYEHIEPAPPAAGA